MSGEKSDWCWNRVHIVGFVCGEAERKQQATKVDKEWNRPWCENCPECRAFPGRCT